MYIVRKILNIIWFDIFFDIHFFWQTIVNFFCQITLYVYIFFIRSYREFSSEYSYIRTLKKEQQIYFLNWIIEKKIEKPKIKELNLWTIKNVFYSLLNILPSCCSRHCRHLLETPIIAFSKKFWGMYFLTELQSSVRKFEHLK
jgi:hypothetical protein